MKMYGFFEQKSVTLDVWGELTVDGAEAIYSVLPCVHPCLLTGTRIWTHTRTVGTVQLLGTFSSPQKKDPINRLFMASKPYIWGHFRGPHKLVKN